MSVTHAGGAKCAVIAVMLCAALSYSTPYSLRDRAESSGEDAPDHTSVSDQTEEYTALQDGKLSQHFQKGEPTEVSYTTTKTYIRSGRRRRREVDATYLVVQHSLTMGNLTLVKTPMMASFDALKYCQRDGGHVAVARSQEDIDTLRTLLALSSCDHDLYIYEAYVNILKSVTHKQHTVYDYHGYDAVLDSSLESAEVLAEDKCTTLRKDGVFNKVDCKWSLAFFCEASSSAALRP